MAVLRWHHPVWWPVLIHQCTQSHTEDQLETQNVKYTKHEKAGCCRSNPPPLGVGSSWFVYFCQFLHPKLTFPDGRIRANLNKTTKQHQKSIVVSKKGLFIDGIIYVLRYECCSLIILWRACSARLLRTGDGHNCMISRGSEVHV